MKKKYLILIPLLILTIFLIKNISNSEITYKEETKYYTGELLSPNFSANLLDNLESKDNVVISPLNIISSMSILYNGSDNNTYKELKRFLNNDIESNNEYILSILNNLNSKTELDSKISSYYESLINEIYSNKYNLLTTKDIKLLSSKSDLTLLLKRTIYTYNLLNNDETYTINQIKNYILTKEETNYNEQTIYSLLQDVLNTYNTYSIKNEIINYNTILYNNSYYQEQLNKDFINTLNKYNSNIYSYNKDTNIKELNNKIKEKSKYNFYLDENTLSNNFISLNSLYMEYSFANIFDSSLTTSLEFYSKDETIITETMLSIEDNYYENNNAYAIKKEFSNNNYSFIAILPKDNSLSLSNINIEDLLNHPKTNQQIKISLPRFTINNDIDLSPILKKNNINDLFTNNCNLSNISDENIKIDYYHQKISFSIGEKGTKSYSVSNTNNIDNTSKQILFNKPFYFMVIDSNNNVLLIGHLTNPNK